MQQVHVCFYTVFINKLIYFWSTVYINNNTYKLLTYLNWYMNFLKLKQENNTEIFNHYFEKWKYF